MLYDRKQYRKNHLVLYQKCFCTSIRTSRTKAYYIVGLMHIFNNGVGFNIRFLTSLLVVGLITKALVFSWQFSVFSKVFMSSNKVKLSDLSFGEIRELEKQAFEGANISRMSLFQIGRRFLSYVLEMNVYQCSFDEVRNEYIMQVGKDDVPESESEFYKYISKRYLWLDKEPKDELLKSFFQAKDDLKSVDGHIYFINDKLAELENKKKVNGWLSGKDRYERNLYEYYKDKNENAKDEILKFISKDIEFYSLMNCNKIPYPNAINIVNELVVGRMPYSYSRGLFFSNEFDRYDVRNMTELSNKFLDFSVPMVREIRKLYFEDKNEFYLFAKNYISLGFEGTKSVIDKINDYIEKSHIVAKRKDVILTILKHYQKGDFISVVNMLPMQIEGLFHDICLEIGIDESRLDISSINEKLRIIKSKMNHFIYFEYYSFKFPVVRNLVAHGKLIEDDFEHTAIMLILDVLPVCELSMSEEIPTVKKIKLLKSSLEDDYESLIEYFDYLDHKIPEFYGLEDDIKVVEEKFDCDNFWAYLRSELKKEKSEKVDNSKIMKFIKKLHSSKLAKVNSKKFLKSMSQIIKEIKEAELERKKQLEPFLNIIKRTNK